MTAQELLAKWDRGEAIKVVGFHNQLDREIYIAMFEILRMTLADITRPVVLDPPEGGTLEEKKWFSEVLLPKALQLPEVAMLEIVYPPAMYAAFNAAGLITRLGYDAAMELAPEDRLIEVRKAAVH